MRRAFLQRPPERVANHFFISAQSRTPKPQHFDTVRLQKSIPDTVGNLMSRQAVLKTVYLNVQFCFVAKEIQNVRPDRMLAAKFAFGKAVVAQPRPHQSFAPGFAFAQGARDAGYLWRLFQHHSLSQFSRLSLTPALSRWERENDLAASRELGRRVWFDSRGNNVKRRQIFPLPAGEGKGEGEWLNGLWR